MLAALWILAQPSWAISIKRITVTSDLIEDGAVTPSKLVATSTYTVGGMIINGVRYVGALSNSNLRIVACASLPCQAHSTTDQDIYTATGSIAGQWRNSRLGIGP